MFRQHGYTPKSTQKGVAIIEALIAILIFSIGVLGIVGMQANMVQNTTDAKFRADASNVAKQQIGKLWADPANLPAVSAVYNAPELPNGNVTITRNGTLFTITVTWQTPSEPTHSYTTNASIVEAKP